MLITTLIPAYNQEEYIDATIDSAVMQIGRFRHEILVGSDGSTDQTREKAKSWQRRLPLLVRDHSLDVNIGISANFRRLFDTASGEYTAILEGDDLWTDPEKLEKQRRFLDENPDCSMVFSMILVRQLPSGKESLLDRQTRPIKSKLSGNDFLADPSLNLIANFSSCMIRTRLIKNFPDQLFSARFNEIAMAFFLENHGYIGFIKEVMSVYHQHAGGVWTGASRIDQLKSAIATRKLALSVADEKYHPALREIIAEREAELCKLESLPA